MPHDCSCWSMNSSLRFTQKILFKAALPVVQPVGMFENVRAGRQVNDTYDSWEGGYKFKRNKG